MTTIAKIEVFPLRYPLAAGYGSAKGLVESRETTLVRAESSDGAVGWGESFGPTAAMVPLARDVAGPLAGAGLDTPVPFVTAALQQHYHRGGGLYTAAVSGVETALWDLMGRTLGVSVATLLGGRARDHVTPYASAGYVTPDRDPEQFRVALQRAVDGTVGAKIKCGLGLAEDRRRVEIAREVLGAERALMIDANGNYTADQVIRLARELGHVSLAWLEEPLPPDDVEGLAMLRQCGVPLATGEALYTRAPFRKLVAERLVDVVQPDITKVGGLTEARAVCDLARTWNVRVSPHVWGSAVGLAAALQLLASIPDYPHTANIPEPLWLELDRGDNGLRERLLTRPLAPAEGVVAVPDDPGLGVDVDEDALTQLREDR